MIKKLILIITCAVVLNADLNTKIKNLLGEEEYQTHLNLINYIFKDQSIYYNNEQVNYPLLTQTLKDNGLLKLDLSQSNQIEVTFQFTKNPTKSLKILKDTLRSLGYYYYFTQEAIANQNGFVWNIILKTESAINPLKLSKSLSLLNCDVTDIKREGNYKWYYSINSNNSEIYKALDLITNTELRLKKPAKPYMIKVDNLQNLSVYSNSGNRWHPKIVFYDNELNIIEIFKEDSLHRNLTIQVPDYTKYIKIDDLYNLANLKRGISITKE